MKDHCVCLLRSGCAFSLPYPLLIRAELNFVVEGLRNQHFSVSEGKTSTFPGVIRSRLSGNEGCLADKCLAMITKPRLRKASKVFSFQKQQIQLRLAVCVMYVEASVQVVCGLARWIKSQICPGVAPQEPLELHQEPEQQSTHHTATLGSQRCHSRAWCYSSLKASNSSLKLVTVLIKAGGAGGG